MLDKTIRGWVHTAALWNCGAWWASLRAARRYVLALPPRAAGLSSPPKESAQRRACWLAVVKICRTMHGFSCDCLQSSRCSEARSTMRLMKCSAYGQLAGTQALHVGSRLLACDYWMHALVMHQPCLLVIGMVPCMSMLDSSKVV